jgi:BirA family biotin operon repressor/biotin-[acetyl-CoA-carboxylase] ligase
VVGIGINVNQVNFASNAPNPVSMKMVSGFEYDLNKTLNSLLEFIFSRYAQAKNNLCSQIENDYLKAMFRLMEWHYFEIQGSKCEARITGTNQYGQLKLETHTKQIVVCDIKEVKFLI